MYVPKKVISIKCFAKKVFSQEIKTGIGPWSKYRGSSTHLWFYDLKTCPDNSMHRTLDIVFCVVAAWSLDEDDFAVCLFFMSSLYLWKNSGAQDRANSPRDSQNTMIASWLHSPNVFSSLEPNKLESNCIPVWSISPLVLHMHLQFTVVWKV